MHSLERALIQIERILLVDDQFEDVFTLVADKSTRNRYIDSLLAAARVDGGVPVHLCWRSGPTYANCLDQRMPISDASPVLGPFGGCSGCSTRRDSSC